MCNTDLIMHQLHIIYLFILFTSMSYGLILAMGEHTAGDFEGLRQNSILYLNSA